jgi:hypothetical protein
MGTEIKIPKPRRLRSATTAEVEAAVNGLRKMQDWPDADKELVALYLALGEQELERRRARAN